MRPEPDQLKRAGEVAFGFDLKTPGDRACSACGGKY